MRDEEEEERERDVGRREEERRSFIVLETLGCWWIHINLGLFSTAIARGSDIHLVVAFTHKSRRRSRMISEVNTSSSPITCREPIGF